MSKKVDERVVEMRFDNAQFESATKQTMSTLDKLKNALKFPSSSKSLDNLSKAAKGVDFSGMAKGIETVNARFSAMQVIGMTALSNITSAVMRAGSNLVNSFTMEPVISGFREYETQLNSVQTILANTSSKGTTMDQVTAALDELNTYADQTIYNFTEMTRNIGTFTAAGVDLETSVSAIKGIANLAAVSGSTSQQASTAMYQLSQALAAGRVSLMDWNSVVNAGMGGEVFQNALKRTATVMGKDVDGLIEKYGSFRESLTSGEWLTTDVLTATLEQFTMAAKEGSEEWENYKKSLMDTGYTEAQAIEILKMANTATDAATKVKTFTQLMDTLKEAMGSGWAKTWQLIFGDFEEAKEFWTGISDGLGDMINNFSDARNNVIAEAMGMGGGESRFGEFTAELEKAGVSVDEFQSKLAEVYSAASGGGSLDELITQYGSLEDAMGSGSVTADMVAKTLEELSVSTDKASGSMKALADWQKVVDDVWYGTYGNIDTGRMERLAAAGWEYAEVQKLVNMTVDGHRLTLEDLTAAQIESMGYTKEQAEALANLAQEASQSGSSLNGLINDILEPKKSGRELFLEGLENTLNAILKPLKAVAEAFNDVFGMNADQLYNLIKGFNEFSKAIIISDTDAANLRSTFKGLFSIIHLLGSIFSKSLTMGIKAANAVLAPFGTDLLTVTGVIGEAFYAFDQWISSGTAFEDTISAIGDALSWVITPLQNFLAGFSNLPGISTVVAKIKGLFDTITGYFSKFDGLSAKDIFTTILTDIQNAFTNAHEKIKNLKWEDILNGLRDFGKKVGEFFTDLVDDMKEIGPDIIEGLQNGLTKGVEGVLEFLRDLATKIIEAVKAVLGIQSPSTVFFEIGVNIIEGLVNGIKYVSGQVADTIHALVDDIKYALSGVNWDFILPVAGGIGAFAILFQLTDALQGFSTAAQNFSKPFASVAGVADSVKTTVDGFNNLTGLKDLAGGNQSKNFKNMAEGVKILAEAIAILAGSVAALTLVDQSKLQGAVLAIGGIAVIVGVLAAALNKFAAGGTVLESLQLNTTLIALGAAFVLFAAAAKIMGTMDYGAVESAKRMLESFIGVIAVLVLLSNYGKGLSGVASFLKQLGVAFLLLSVSAKLLGTMDATQVSAAQDMLVAFGAVISLLMAVTQVGGKGIKKASSFIKEIGIAFLLLSVAAKIMGGMSSSELEAAISAIALLGLIVAGLMAATVLIGGGKIAEIGNTLMQVVGSIAILALVAVAIGSVDSGQLFNGIGAIAVLGLLVTGLMAIVKLMGTGEMVKVGTTLLSMSLAIGILGGICVLLGMVDPKQLAQGVIAVGFLAAMVAAMALATKGASDIQGTMIGMAVAIGVMAASVAVLSFLDPAAVQNATLCMAALIAVFGMAVRMSSDVQTSLGVFIVMGVVVGLMGAVLSILAQQPWENVVASAAAMSTFLIAFAGAIAIIGTVKEVSNTALITVGVMTLVVAALGAVLWGMSALDVQNAIPNAIALTIVLGALTGVTAALAALGPKAAAAQAALPAFGIIAGAITAVIGIAGLLNQFTGGAIAGWIESGGEVLSALGGAIGGFVGSIVGGALSGLTDDLVTVGDNLAAFATSAQPFFDAVSGIDPSIGSTIKNIGDGMLALVGGGWLEKLSGIFGDSSLESLTTQLPLLGVALTGFAMSTVMVDAEKVNTASQALKTVIEAMSSVPTSGGFLGMIFGNQDLASFSTGMTSMGEALKAFNDSSEGITPETIQPKAEALKAVISALSEVPSSGGLLGMLFGDKDFGSFAEGMKSVGEALKNFYENTTGIENPDNLRMIGEALGVLVKALAEVPSSGGWLDNLFGGQDYTNFKSGLESIGEGISNFNDKTSGIKDAGVFSTIVNATKTLIDGLANIPAEGGLLSSIFGGQNFEGFSTAIGNIATGVATLGNVANNVTDVGKLQTVVSATNTLITGLSGITSVGGLFSMILAGTDMSTLSTALKNLGSGIDGFAAATASTEFGNTQSAVDALNKILTFIQDVTEIDTSGIESFKSAVDSLAETNVAALVETFNAASGDMGEIGSNFVKAIADGFSNNGSSLTDAASNIITQTLESINGKAGEFGTAGQTLVTELANGVSEYGGQVVSNGEQVIRDTLSAVGNLIAWNFYNLGCDIAYGLRDGIHDMADQVATEAANMVRQAISAAKAAADSNSPSKKFYQLGEWSGMGYVNALNDYAPIAAKASANMVDSSLDGVKNTMSLMSEALNSDLDVNPTIRPVLDLSEIKNGANYINDTFSNLTPDSTLSRVSTINRSMNSRIQNGTFDDVVSAIDKLRGTVSELERPTYNVAGITYDDGSAVATAVNQLTRAIRIERRT